VLPWLVPTPLSAAAALRSTPLASELPEGDRDRLSGIAVTRSVRKGQLLFSDGDACAGLFLVTQGRVKLFKLSPDGREKVIHLVSPGETFAEAALFGDGRYPVNAEAVDAVSLLLLPREPLLRLLREDPGLSFRMLASMASRLKRFVHQVEDLTFQSAAQRLAYHILSEASPGQRTARLSLQKKDLAAHLGMTPETLSRILASLRAQGTVTVKGPAITILDDEALRSVAAGRHLTAHDAG
jgi:CRP-like cAMP-binding protein